MSQSNAITLVANFASLMILAKAVGDAKKRGDSVALAEAIARHDAYKDICLRTDRVLLGVTRCELQ